MTTLNVLSAGAVKPALALLGPAFAEVQGIEVALAFGPAPELRARTKDGTGDFGVIIGPRRLIEALAAEGKVERRVALGGVKAAVAVHKDAPEPDISTPERLRAAVLAARTIAYNTASSGQYIERMIRSLGIAEAVESRTRRFPTAEDAMRFLGSPEGVAAIGFGQTSAIRGYEKALGVRLVGALPDAVGNVTEYEAAVAATAPVPALAEAFLAHLARADSRAALRAIGVE